MRNLYRVKMRADTKHSSTSSTQYVYADRPSRAERIAIRYGWRSTLPKPTVETTRIYPINKPGKEQDHE